MDEYVAQAMACGIDIFGFSDHAPMAFDERYRMRFDEMALYREEFTRLKERYDLELLFGYEVDYLEGYMDERVLGAEVDYLIGSVHFIEKWGFDNPEFIGRYESEDIDEIWRKYFHHIEQMAKSRLFDIVGHLDLIKVFKFLPKSDIVALATPALEAIKAADMVLEINVAGFRKPVGEAYPSKALLQKAYELGIAITFGSDAHEPAQVGLFREEAEALVKSVGYERCATFRNRKRELVKF